MAHRGLWFSDPAEFYRRRARVPDGTIKKNLRGPEVTTRDLVEAILLRNAVVSKSNPERQGGSA
jgi:hypothetical protein